MAEGEGTGAPPQDLVKNSALAFAACAQVFNPQQQNDVKDLNQADKLERMMPAGLKALCEVYSRLYPDQPNPLQVTTRLKYWLGGQDPLDYISMYWNPGKPEENIPSHWHYVTFGLSDLHGDGRVHPPSPTSTPGVPPVPPVPPISGLGCELTLRLESPAAPPPLWPSTLLQNLARYLFTTGNKFYPGDHISWHYALDGTNSKIKHLLVAEEPALNPTVTPYGSVSFLQIVGCTGKELRAAQRGSGFDVLQMLKEDPSSGGPYLITNMSRNSCVKLSTMSSESPAHLAGVTANFTWTGVKQESEEMWSPKVEQQIKDTLKRGLNTMSSRTGSEGHSRMSWDSLELSSLELALPSLTPRSQKYKDISLTMGAEAAALLKLAIDGRILHGRHFSYRWQHRSVTLVARGVVGALVSEHEPYVCSEHWLQMYIPKELALEMSKQVACLSRLAETDSESDSEENKTPMPVLPLTLDFQKYNLKINVVHDLDMLYIPDS